MMCKNGFEGLSRRGFLKTIGIGAAGLAGGFLTTQGSAFGLQAIVEFDYQFSWARAMHFSGFILGKELGYYEEVGLNPSYFPSEGLAAVRTTAQGLVDMADQAAVSVATAVGQEIPIISVGTIFQDNPSGIVSLEKFGIKTPKDLEGKKVAISAGDDEYPLYLAILQAAGADASKIEEVEIGQGGSEALLQNKVQGYVGWYNYTPNALREIGERPVTFLPSDFGLNTYGNVLIVAANKLQDSQGFDEVVRFTQATARGYAWVLNNLDEAFERLLGMRNDLADLSTFSEVVGRAVFLGYHRNIVSAATGENGLLTANSETWGGIVDMLDEGGILATRPSVDSLFTDEVLKKVDLPKISREDVDLDARYQAAVQALLS